jgi:hypothetical protein
MRFELIRKPFLRQLHLPIGLQEFRNGRPQGILSQATVYLPTAPSGLEPEIFAFKEQDVANYTTRQRNEMAAPVGLEPTTLRLTSDRSAIEL